jgi:predicted dehydrogenase
MSDSGPFRVAIVGCGNIAQSYFSTIAKRPEELKIVGAFDLDRSRAEALTKEHGGKVYETLDAVLGDPQVEAVINLTIHQAHVEVCTKCFEAGKHVLTEKPIALDPGDAMRLVDLARRKRVRFAAAPTTSLGEAQQTAWKLIRDGRLGTVRVVYAERNWGRIEGWHPNPGPFYAVGAMYDVGVYPLMFATAIFGNAVRAGAFGKVVNPDRVTKEGKPFHIDTADWLCGVVEFASGTMMRLTSSFYVGPTKQTGLEFHGDKASIVTNDTPFDAKVELRDFGTSEWTDQPLVRPGYDGIDWSRGVIDLREAVRDNREPRCSGAQAAHVVEIIAAMHASAKSGGKSIDIRSTFEPPLPMEWAS